MAKAQFNVKIENDGTITWESGNLQGEHHHSADEFLRFLTEKLGSADVVKTNKNKLHRHADGTEHSHNEV